MAQTGSFVKLLRQLSAAKDSYRSGAMDITWEEGKASLYLVFGQPNHAVLETDAGVHMEGQPALAELVMLLPSRFKIAPWRKEVVRNETLSCTIDELIAPFAELAGTKTDETYEQELQLTASRDPLYGEASSERRLGLDDFPLLPLGPSMWSDADAHVVHLDVLIPKLPPSIVVLSAPKLRAAAIIVRGSIIDAIWVEEDESVFGEGAGMALIGAKEGTLSGYRLASDSVAESLSMLWRTPLAYGAMQASWFNADAILAGLLAGQRSAVLEFTTVSDRAIAIFSLGQLVAAYSGKDREVHNDPQRVKDYFAQGGNISIYQTAAGKMAVPPVDSVVHRQVEGGSLSTDELSAALGAPPTVPDAANAAAPGEGPPSLLDEPAATTTDSPDLVAWAPVNQGDSAPVAPTEENQENLPPLGPPPSLFDEQPLADPNAAAWMTAGLNLDPNYRGAGTQQWDPSAPAATDTPPHAPSDDQPSDAGSNPVDTPMATPPQDPVTPSAPSIMDEEPAFVPLAPVAQSGWTPQVVGSETSGTANSISFAEDGDDEDPLEEEARLDLDIDAIKAELIQIGVRWLGSDSVQGIITIIQATPPTVDDFVQTIERIKNTEVPGYDPSVVRSMAREMHYYAAEALCGA